MNYQEAEEMIRKNSFITAFQDMQQDAAEINKKNGFSTDDPLIDEFEQWFVNQSLDWTAGGNVESAMCYEKFKPLFAVMRNARVGLKLALVMGELGETLEAVRKTLGPDSHCPEFSAEETEVADAIIRLMNYAVDRKLRLAEAIVAKNEYNRNRADQGRPCIQARQTILTEGTMSNLRVYLAAPYALKAIIELRARQLRSLGIDVTSSWIEEPHKSTIQMEDLTPDLHCKYALQDVFDVEAADVLVFQPDVTKTIIRAGRHVEFGIAVALRMPIIVVGMDFENIFHYLPDVRHVETWEAAVDTLRQMDKAARNK